MMNARLVAVVRMYVEDDTSMKKLYITSIVNSDAGTYTCRATIDGVTHSKSTQLSVFSTYLIQRLFQINGHLNGEKQ